jgi:hypothetical protein
MRRPEYVAEELELRGVFRPAESRLERRDEQGSAATPVSDAQTLSMRERAVTPAA